MAVLHLQLQYPEQYLDEILKGRTLLARERGMLQCIKGRKKKEDEDPSKTFL